jgi:NAD(P)H-dependent flavin oxidoreductase YrpB (nitropropane dioxygenase family)
MLKTPLCDLFGVDVPIILAPMGSCTSAELAAAVSNQGGLGGGTEVPGRGASAADVTRRCSPAAYAHLGLESDSRK